MGKLIYRYVTEIQIIQRSNYPITDMGINMDDELEKKAGNS